MKKYMNYLLPIFMLSIFLLEGCDDNDFRADITPPQAPRNVYTITGENRVDVFWDHVSDSDLAGYNVYWSEDNNQFIELGYTEADYFIDNEANNGVKTYYAVTAYDFNGNESELSYETAYSTPRPEGFNQLLVDLNTNEDLAGFVFAERLVVNFSDLETDFFFDIDEGVPYLNVWEPTKIKDAGITNDIHEIDYVDAGGWVTEDWYTFTDIPDKVYYSEVFLGHTYLLRTQYNNYAKLRIIEITDNSISFDWAYQIVEGNPELEKKTERKVRIKSGQKVKIKR